MSNELNLAAVQFVTVTETVVRCIQLELPAELAGTELELAAFDMAMSCHRTDWDETFSGFSLQSKEA